MDHPVDVCYNLVQKFEISTFVVEISLMILKFQACMLKL